MTKAKQPRRASGTAVTASVAMLNGRRPSTKELLIDEGERLFGERGFDGVSLREIAGAAGQSNSNVVQYHFSDKPGLISAILQDRVSRIEQVRLMQLAMLDNRGPIDARQLLKVLWLPLMSIRDERGAHSYCRFMLQYMLHPKLTTHPLAAIYNMPEGSPTGDALPCGRRTTQLLYTLYADRPKTVTLKRLAALAMMFLASVVEHDNRRLRDGRTTDTEFDIDTILDMAVAALAAPA